MNMDSNTSMPLQVGDQVTVTIERLASGGDGVTHVDGFTLFVPYSAPGDVAEVAVVQMTKNYGRAQIVSLVTAGPDRVPSGCPLAGQCPGCQLQHLRYEAQLDAKTAFVRDGLERIGRVSGVDVRPTMGMADPWRYRNKGEFIANVADGVVRLGYHSDGEDGFAPIPDCPIQHPLSIKILRAVEEVATQEHLPLAQLITRVSPSEGEALAILVCWDWDERLRAAAALLQERVPELVGVHWSRVRGRSVVRRTLAEPLTGRSTLVQHLGEWMYTVSTESFFQVNLEQATQLLNQAIDFAGDMREAIFADAYCGVGTFLIPLAKRANRAFGIEEHPAALRDAETNVARYALHDTKLYEGRVEVVLSRLQRKGRSLDVALLDPPRKGAGRLVLESIASLGAQRLLLVSCDPATLGRDAGDLQALGYRILAVQPVDMFPQTWHVETILLAEK